MDRRSLRKLNHSKNQPNPIPPEDQKGSLGDRDRNTGNYSTKLNNQGSYQATPLFKSSVAKNTEIQLNEATKTADYVSSEFDKKKLEGTRFRRAIPATGVPDPNPFDPENNNPNNPNFGNCRVCNGETIVPVNCPSGYATVNFGDGSTEQIKTPAELQNAAKATFNYVGGGSGEITIDSCGNVLITDGKEDLGDPLDLSDYGTLIYSRQASSVSIGGISGSELKGFELYQKNCTVTGIGVKEEGVRELLGTSFCDSLSGGYGVIEPSSCLIIGDQKRCGIDPESIEYKCVVQGYRLCNKYQVSWRTSTGELRTISRCEQIGYTVVSEPSDEFYSPGPRPSGDGFDIGFLRYDSGIPRTFGVDGLDSGGGAYFQIYQNPDNPCDYEVVAVTVTGAKQTFSGAITNKTYSTIYRGGCGFEITLGAFISDQFLRVYDNEGTIILETQDFIPSSVLGCDYLGGKGAAARFQGNCRSSEVERVPIFEKEIDSSDENGLSVDGHTCGDLP